eukprot:CAMPEP_0117538334 /NCGR_PEP_ID=MMETSP0784-20121206/42426_1 /TAXON_ID=39447 /ORGANISM="" /LENGTH=417 /DNA_ID=CAMNT_0005334947 /DNA_START=1 /DNA_END=1254 /DNA_ORIENTATION=-
MHTMLRARRFVAAAWRARRGVAFEGARRPPPASGEGVSWCAKAAGGSLTAGVLGFALQRHSACQTRDTSRDTPLDVRLGLTNAADTAFPVGWGILGAGDISSDWAKSLADVPGANLIAVAARSVEKATEFAATHGVLRVHQTYKELVADPAVDVVYVGTITSLHKEHTMLAIAAGKHVLCEKPLAESEADAREMYEAAAAKGVMLQEGMWTRFFPAVDHARYELEKGTIGEVVMVQADFPDQCYAIQAAPLGFGATDLPTMVAATSCGNAANAVLAQYGGRGCAVMSFPVWDCEYPEVIEIIGKKGRITLDPWGHHPTRVTVRTTPPELLALGPGQHTSTSQNNTTPKTEQSEYPIPLPSGVPAPGWHFSNQHGFVYQAEAIHRCLAAGLRECPQYTREDSLHVMHILDFVAAQSGK